MDSVDKGKLKYGNSTAEEIMNPGDVDESIWKKAKAAADKEYGEGHWGAISEIYKKMGGKFHRKD